MIPLSLYVHIPWCEKKCPYCDFNSHAVKATIDDAAYVAALLQDLNQDLESFPGVQDKELSSIFIGGGTPSLFSESAIETLLRGIEQRIGCADDIEVTMEANPGSSEAQRFAAFRNAGVNRLSIGVQSFNDHHLGELGRVHSAEQAMSAFQAARQAGFENINIDLMYALPNQQLHEASKDIEQAIALAPEHISCYQLTIEPNTLFFHDPPPRPDDEASWEMQLALQDLLAAGGYQQYEVSAYARQGRQCRHNLNYWRFGDYLGIGAGAHGKLTNASAIERYWKQKHPASYQSAVTGSHREFVGGRHTVASEQLPFEFMMNALRLLQGFESELFKQRTGLDQATLESLIVRQVEDGLIELIDGRVRASDRGRRFLDSLLQEYLPD